MKKIVSLIIACFCIYSLNAQVSIHKPTPSTPEIQWLAKYGMIPVSHYTGVPNISVPIYTLQDGEINLPISMSYHASGLKIDERASWVGLGWSLNAGGAIFRSVKSAPDEKNRIIKDFNQKDLKINDIYDILGNYADSEPDIYTYNINGYSGQFLLDKNLNPPLYFK